MRWKEPNIYLRAVPAKHRDLSGIGVFRSRLIEVGTDRVNRVWTTRNGDQHISPAAYCVLRRGGRPKSLLVYETLAPKLVEAMLALGEGVTRGERRLRYLRVFHAYECLVTTKDPQLVAVRHGLSHARSMLSHPRTVATLTQIFGTTHIDLSSVAHRRLFDTYLGLLLMKVDDEIVASLDARFMDWQLLPPSAHPVVPRVSARYERVPPALRRGANRSVGRGA